MRNIRKKPLKKDTPNNNAEELETLFTSLLLKKASKQDTSTYGLQVTGSPSLYNKH